MNFYQRCIRSFFIVMIMTTFIVSCVNTKENLLGGLNSTIPTECISLTSLPSQKCIMDASINAAVIYTFGAETAEAIMSVDISGFQRADPIQAVQITLTMLNKADHEFIQGSIDIAKALGIKDKEVINRLKSLDKKYARGVKLKIDKETSEVTKQAAAIISSTIKAGNFKLSKKEKKLLAKGMLDWKKGSVYQTYTTLGLRSFPDKFTGDGANQAILRIAQTKELGMTKSEVIGLPKSIMKWLKNTVKIVNLMRDIQALEDVSSINKREMELASEEAMQDVDKTFTKYGVETVPDVPDFN